MYLGGVTPSDSLHAAYEERWRRFLILVTPIGILAFLVCSLFEVFGDQPLIFDLISYPVGAAFMCVIELLLIFCPNRVRTSIAAAVFGLSIFFLARLCYLFSIAGGEVDIPAQLSEGFYWMPLIALLAMSFPQVKSGRRVQTIFIPAFSLTALLFIGFGIFLERWEIVNAVTQISLANAAIFLLVRVYASSRDDLAVMQAQLTVTEQYAHTDTITQLPNRRKLEAFLEAQISAAERNNSRFTVLFIDLDNFKLVNDVLGHDTGDRVLFEVSQRMKSVIDKRHFIARQSGDEFVAVMEENTTTDEVQETVKRLQGAIYAPLLAEKSDALLTASIGISQYPCDGSTVSELLSHADAAMYRIKHSGKNGAVFYDLEVDDHSEQRRVEKAVGYALEHGELSLYAQPVFDVKTRRVVRAEVLTRWHHGAWGMVSPELFIPAAERSGFIVSMGAWVLEETCRVAAAWAGSCPHLRVSVNVSRVQLAHPGFAETVRQVLANSGLPPGVLELEMTESVLSANLTQTYRTLEQLRELGVGLVLDDFGKGYSSLSCLKDFPFDVIKVDKSFVADLLGSDDSQAYSRAVLSGVKQIATHLGVALVAEGVETEAQFGLCKTLGYDFAQGYLLARPMPIAEIPAFIAQKPLQPPESSAQLLSLRS